MCTSDISSSCVCMWVCLLIFFIVFLCFFVFFCVCLGRHTYSQVIIECKWWCQNSYSKSVFFPLLPSCLPVQADFISILHTHLHEIHLHETQSNISATSPTVLPMRSEFRLSTVIVDERWRQILTQHVQSNRVYCTFQQCVKERIITFILYFFIFCNSLLLLESVLGQSMGPVP